MSNHMEQRSDYAIAAVVYADEGDAAITALWQAVRQLQQDGWRVAGLLNPIDDNGRHCNSKLASVADGRCFPIFQNLGRNADGCKLDSGALATAGSVIREAIEEGVDLVVINKCQPLTKAQLQRVFDPFYHTDSQISPESDGSGVGLYIVKMLLEAKGLEYSFSPVKQGMAFTIYFP